MIFLGKLRFKTERFTIYSFAIVSFILISLMAPEFMIPLGGVVIAILLELDVREWKSFAILEKNELVIITYYFFGLLKKTIKTKIENPEILHSKSANDSFSSPSLNKKMNCTIIFKKAEN